MRSNYAYCGNNMRSALIQLAVLFVSLKIVVAQSGEANFFRHEGRYTPQPTASVEISADASGILGYTTEWVYHEGRETNRITSKMSLGIHREARFLGYYDRSSRTFWFATEKRIFSESWHGTTNYISSTYDHTADTLLKVPDSFRKEVQRLFKSP